MRLGFAARHGAPMCGRSPVRGVPSAWRDALPNPDLDPEQRRLQRDVVRRNADDPEELRHVLAELRREEVVRRPVAKAMAHVGVDVGRQQGRLLPRQPVEARRLRVGGALGQHEAEVLVAALDVRLLVRCARPAVEDGGEPDPSVLLDRRRVGELAPVVGEDDREERREPFAHPSPHRSRSASLIDLNTPSTHSLVFASTGNASMKPNGLKTSVSSALPPLGPSTVSISTTRTPGCSSTNAR